MSKPVIGILGYRTGRNTFMNAKFLRDLVNEGRRKGAVSYVFSYKDVWEDRKAVRGFTPGTDGKWRGKPSPWPDVVIDFCRRLTKPHLAMRRRKDLFPFANHKFTYKWRSMQLFASSDELKGWIPETHLFSVKRLEQMLRKYPIVYVKPADGTGGMGVVKIMGKSGSYLIQGRKRSGRLSKAEAPSLSEAARIIGRWVRTEKFRSGTFMVQQGLNLKLLPDRVMDVRLLIQKNGHGEWEVTGKAFRVGAKNSPTTNLIYGDGKAFRFLPFLESRFGSDKAKEIDGQCDRLALQVTKFIEERFGSMVEFGLDVGIDTEGRVWLIEVNPKPSHEAFLKTKELTVYRKSIERPIQYAIFLASPPPKETPKEE